MSSTEVMQTTRYNQGVREFWTPNWMYNAAHNVDTIYKMYQQVGPHLDISRCPRSGIGPDGNPIPALILGSGPSFDKGLPYIKGFAGPIFCSPSHAMVLDALKRHPDYMIALDTTTRVLDQLHDNIQWHGTTLLAHPSMCPQLFSEKWKQPWNMHLFRMFEPDNSTLEMLYDALFPYITGRVVNSGCVVNNMILIAASLGYSPIYLLGADFGYPTPHQLYTAEELLELTRPKPVPNMTPQMNETLAREMKDWQKLKDRYDKDPDTIYEVKGHFKKDLDRGLLRFKDYVSIGVGVWEPKEFDYTDVVRDPTLIISDDKIFTTPVNIFYKHTLLSNWALMANQLVNCSHGMLKSSGLPFIEFSEVVAKAGRGIASKQGDPMWMTPEEINRRALGYLIPRGIYPKRGKNGEIKGVELIDGLKSKYQQSKMEFEMFDKFDKKWTQLPDGSWRRVLDDTELNLGEIEYK
jgi:hypothetical protein